jgi:hypothetical protein
MRAFLGTLLLILCTRGQTNAHNQSDISIDGQWSTLLQLNYNGREQFVTSMQGVFSYLDVNSDGDVNEAEFVSGMMRMGTNTTNNTSPTFTKFTGLEALMADGDKIGKRSWRTMWRIFVGRNGILSCSGFHF